MGKFFSQFICMMTPLHIAHLDCFIPGDLGQSIYDLDRVFCVSQITLHTEVFHRQPFLRNSRHFFNRNTCNISCTSARCNTQIVRKHKSRNFSPLYIYMCYLHLSSHVNNIFKKQIINKKIYATKLCIILEFLL